MKRINRLLIGGACSEWETRMMWFRHLCLVGLGGNKAAREAARFKFCTKSLDASEIRWMDTYLAGRWDKWLVFSSLLLLCPVCLRVGRSLIRSNNRASRYVAFQFLLIWFCCVYSKLIYLQWYHGTIHHFTKSCLALAPQNCKWEPLERGRHQIDKYEPRKPHAVFILLIENPYFDDHRIFSSSH